MTDGGKAKIRARVDAGGGLVEVTLDPPPDVHAEYTVPGQYVEIRAAGGKGFFVLSRPPTADGFSLLVRRAGDAAEALLTLDLGADVTISRVLGRGFPVADLGDAALVLALAGSAIGVAPAVLGVLTSRQLRTTRVFLGVRTRADAPLLETFERAREAGATITWCLSREVHDGAGHARGRVHEVLFREAVPPRARIFAAGHDAMIEAVRTAAGAREIPVFTNL